MNTPIRVLAIALFIVGPLAIAAPVIAQDDIVADTDEKTPLELRADQVVAVINGEVEPSEVFTDGFLAAVPPAQLAAISQQLTTQYGAAVAVESLDPPSGTRAALAIRMESAIARGGIAIAPGEDGRVSEMLFQTFEPIGDNAEKIEADLAALPGDVSWYYGTTDDLLPPILDNGTAQQMPIGSTFKLYVLATLAREIAEGRRSWGDVVTLGEPRSYPSGRMQDWPTPSDVTLETLANLMISISDNTATDALIRELGRDAVYETLVASGHAAPELNDPFLMTREMFLLKGGPEDRLALYQRSDEEIRSQILEAIEDTPVPPSDILAAFSNGPNALDVEWFASANDIRALFRYMRGTADTRAFEVMAINTNMAREQAENWAYAGYKGGSEPGVLNLSWLLTDENGHDLALVLSWRNTEADLAEGQLEQIAQRILQLER